MASVPPPPPATPERPDRPPPPGALAIRFGRREIDAAGGDTDAFTDGTAAPMTDGTNADGPKADGTTADGAKANGAVADRAPDVDAVVSGALRRLQATDVAQLVGEILVALFLIGALAVYPDQAEQIIARGTAIVAGSWLLFDTARRLGAASRQVWRAVLDAVVLAALVFVAIDPDEHLPVAGRVAGVCLLAIVVAEVVRRRRHRIATPHPARDTLVALVGVALVAMPAVVVTVLVWVGALLLVVRLALESALRLRLLHLDPDDERPLLVRWIDHNSERNYDRATIAEELFYEGTTAATRLLRYTVLMLFASAIATMGVLTDSTAVVIGAMLIAPLITPMMGMGLALAIGWPKRLARSTLAMLLGMIIAVGMGWLLATTLALRVDLTANSQIVSRSSPTIADLVIAVAAGAAGAYALARKDVSASLPGVAIAIALVPPLAVVGVTAQAGDWSQAAGTLLLFLTNLVAIILVGGAVFVVTGVVPVARAGENQHRVRTALAAVVVLGLLVTGALLVNGRSITEVALANDRVRSAVADWLGPETEFSVMSIELSGDTATVVLAGPGDPPDPTELSDRIIAQLDRALIVDVQWIPRERRVIVDAP